MTTTFDPNYGFVAEELVEVRSLNAELQGQIDILQEQWDEAAASILRLRTEDAGWSVIGQVNKTDGFSKRVLQDIAAKAEVQAAGNPLLKRAFELRYNPIFSRGFNLTIADGKKLVPRYKAKLDKTTVQDTLFSEAGIEQLERTCFVVGNLFVGYNRLTGEMIRIPFEQITNRAVDPDIDTRTAYYLREWTRKGFDGQTEDIHEWIPVVEWWADGKDDQDEIAHNTVNHDWVIIDMRVNVPTGGHWGIPDVFPALPYAWAYSEYIRDAASLLKAHNMIAWKVVGKSTTQAQTAGVQLAGQRRAGGVAAMTAGTTIDALPKAGLVNMADGMALAAMVASATGVATPALISTVQGGNAATIQSLDGPTVAMARSRQGRWTDFFRRVFIAMGIEGVSIDFPKITEDPIHRQVASLATGRATGAIWADEYREAFMEAMSIKPTHATAPIPEEYAGAANTIGFLNWMEQEVANAEGGNDPLPRQGNSGVTGKLGEIDNTNRDQARRGGNGTQTDLAG